MPVAAVLQARRHTDYRRFCSRGATGRDNELLRNLSVVRVGDAANPRLRQMKIDWGGVASR
jgi:hypothetical protein